MTNRETRSDLLLVGSVLGALFFSWLLAGVLLAILLKGRPDLSAFRKSYLPFFIAAVWAVGVIATRGMPNYKFFLQFVFISVMPLLIIVYKPTFRTLSLLNKGMLWLFYLDLGFNIFALITGHDLLGRQMDARVGLISGRLGGVFAHSFYSGSISLAAYIIYASSKKTKLFYVIPVLNMMLAGSWRFIAILPVLFFLEVGWKKRGRFIEILAILVTAIGILTGTILTSRFSSYDIPENPSNTFRVYAWMLATEKIISSPIAGVGYPKDNELKNIDLESIDESLTAESYYLSSSLTYGVPYTLLIVLGFALVFYGPVYDQRKKITAILFPLIFIDSVYGEFWASILIYSWLWVIIVASSSSVSLVRLQNSAEKPAMNPS